jgi:hypothetical protein
MESSPARMISHRLVIGSASLFGCQHTIQPADAHHYTTNSANGRAAIRHTKALYERGDPSGTRTPDALLKRPIEGEPQSGSG